MAVFAMDIAGGSSRIHSRALAHIQMASADQRHQPSCPRRGLAQHPASTVLQRSDSLQII